jgi:acetyl esterase/lipase
VDAGRCTISPIGGNLPLECHSFRSHAGNAQHNSAGAHAMRVMIGFAAALMGLMSVGGVSAEEYEIVNHPGVVYATHDGSKLVGDFYLPKGLAKAPVLIAVHGGGWRTGDRNYYRYWGLFLARAGYAVFAIDYRLGKPGMYPAAVYDAKAAVQFVRANAAEFDVDPDRVGLIGDSAGAYLAAMVALAGKRFDAAYRDDPQAGAPSDVRVVVGFYGVYDMLAQWQHDMSVTPGDSIVQDFLGVPPVKNRQVYGDSSPLNHAADRNDVAVLLICGVKDQLVDPASQSGAFVAALTQAGSQASLVMVPGAGHSWVREQFENDPHSYSAQIIPKLMRFLKNTL